MMSASLTRNKRVNSKSTANRFGFVWQRHPPNEPHCDPGDANCQRNEGSWLRLAPHTVAVVRSTTVLTGFFGFMKGGIFNATNTPYFGSPGSVGLTVGTSTFGKVTVAADPRVIQFGLKLLF